jgi:hypothetical protein
VTIDNVHFSFYAGDRPLTVDWSADGVRLELPSQVKPALHLMALYAFERVRELNGMPAQREILPLTDRERVGSRLPLIRTDGTRFADGSSRIRSVTSGWPASAMVSPCRNWP